MSKRGPKPKKIQRKTKFSESSHLNQSGNSVESQIGVAAEQPLHPAEIQHMLQLEREGTARSDHWDDPIVSPSALQAGPSGYTGPIDDYHTTQYLVAGATQPPRSSNDPVHLEELHSQFTPTASQSHQSSTLHPGPSAGYPYQVIQSDVVQHSDFHPDFPPNFDYAPVSLMGPRADWTFTAATGYDGIRNVSRHRSQMIAGRPVPYLITRSSRPGEVIPGERFNISSARQSVIRPLGQPTRTVARNISRARLPPVVQLQAVTTTGHPENNTRLLGPECDSTQFRSSQPANASRHALPAVTIEAIRTDARTNFKRALFSETLLPNPTQLADMIRNALFSAAVGHLEGGVNNWLEKEATAESRKLKDVASSIRGDFKCAARLLTPQLHGLTLPINIRSHEAAFRQQRVTALLHGFYYLDDIQTINGSEIVVPFGHLAVVQLILHVLWRDNYSRYLPDNMDLDVVVAFAGTVVHWVLQDHSDTLVCNSEFNTREHLPTHTRLVERIKGLQGSELERYRELVADICARGEEMIGFTQ